MIRLQNSVDQLNQEIEDRNQLISKLEENSAHIKILFQNAVDKYEEAESEVKVLKVSLLEKEKHESSFKEEINSQLDKALQFIKLIENEFRLDNKGRV